MHPILFQLGPLTLHWYGVLMATGFLAAMLHWMPLARREGQNRTLCSDLLFWLMIAGVLGGRAAYVLADIGFYLRYPTKILRLDEGGLIFYGGLVGAVLAVFLFARSRKLRLLWLFDFVATAAPLGHAFGRLGCFMNGCCFGRPHKGFPSVVFPAGSPPWLQQIHDHAISNLDPQCLPVHPVQLYEVVWNLTVYVILLTAFLRRRRGGLIIGLYLLLYPAGRLVMETFRGTERMFSGALSAAQWISIALMLSGILILFLSRKTSPSATNTPADERTP